MDHSKDVLALLEDLKKQIQEKDAQQQQMQQQIQDLKQEKDAQQQQMQQQILDEKKQRHQQAQQLADELHAFKASSSKKPLAGKSSLMKNVFILIVFLFVCDIIFTAAILVSLYFGFESSLILQLIGCFFGYGVILFSFAWFVCFAPSTKWLLFIFIAQVFLSVLNVVISIIALSVPGTIVYIIFLVINSLLAWQYRSVWRILCARPLEQATPKLFLSLFRTFVYLSIPIVAISVRDQELNDNADGAIQAFSFTSLGLVLFVRSKIQNNETLLQLIFRLNYKEQVFFFLVVLGGYAIFLIDYLFYLSNSVESTAVQLCLLFVGLALITLGALFIVGTVSKLRYLSWFDTESPVAVNNEESIVELRHHLDHVTIDF